MNKVKISATVSPDRLRQAKEITGCANVSEVIERGLASLIARDLERIHADGYARAPQGAEVVDIVDPTVWPQIPWDDE